MPTEPTDDSHETLTVTEARQGNKRMMNTHVLVISTIAIVVLFTIIYFVFLANPPPAGTPL